MKKLLRKLFKLEYDKQGYIFTVFGKKFKKSSTKVALRYLRKRVEEELEATNLHLKISNAKTFEFEKSLKELKRDIKDVVRENNYKMLDQQEGIDNINDKLDTLIKLMKESNK